ncbi:hypothetical protein [Paenibacillus hunanensis]|uniref:NERD domain-containing protein n=1 Tax=Paenibacillus hunanensis TaxID=539262 RepID=A0ABU1IX03_9BACL|nr:hypothetical protein [Paenibacillus hunanensis]MDR6243530.1 hypothetical protein [Paenibacillus hunanensis]GGI98394.1 hypothetical protein GCM10008022_03940 [Paenibacillus hunanensis]
MKKNKIKGTSKKIPPSISIQASYKSLTGRIMSKTEIQHSIEKMPLGSILSVLSDLCSDTLDNSKLIRRFNTHLLKQGKTPLKIDNELICSHQGLMLLWKWIIAYGDVDTVSSFSYDEEEVFYDIILLNLALVDHYSSPLDDNIKYEFFRNLFFNHTTYTYISLSRSVILYTEIAQNRDYFDTKDFMDIGEFFFERYGYTIRDYLHVLTTLWAGYTGNSSKGRIAMDKNYFKRARFYPIAERILDELSLSIEERREWAIDTLNDRWNFTQFIEKPLLEVIPGGYICFHEKLIEELFINQLYFKIRHLYNNNDSQILSFMGRCFEKYVEMLTEKAINLSSLPYELIKEFEWKGRRSPDVLIRLGNKLLAVEVKGHRLKLDSIIGSDSKSIDGDLNRMLNKPISQLYKCIHFLSDRNHHVMKGVEEIHLITVSYGGIPTFLPFEKEFQSIKDSFELPISTINHMDISEYEEMMGLIGNRNAIQLFQMLKNKENISPYESFSNFYARSSFGKKGSRLIRSRFYEIIDETLDLIEKNYNH